MGLLVIPKKAVKVEPPAEMLSPFAEIIDRVGRLTEEAEPVMKKIAALQEQLKPLSAAKAELQAAVNALELPGDDSTGEEIGADFRVEVGKKGSSRGIKNLPKVVELMGVELFLKTATVTLKAIDDYLTPPQKEEVLETSRGSRSYKVLRRAKAK